MKKSVFVSALCAGLCSLLLFQGTATAAVTGSGTTGAIERLRRYKLTHQPDNTTSSCRSWYGPGAMAGTKSCQCKGGYEWNADQTQCIRDGTYEPMTERERMAARMAKKAATMKEQIYRSVSYRGRHYVERRAKKLTGSPLR